MGRHRTVRPRFGRIALAGSALGVTLVAVLGGIGLLPSAAEETPRTIVLETAVEPEPAPEPAAAPELAAAAEPVVDPAALPADSGTGRRVVFSQGAQRVWIVGAGERVRRTYPVSGSVLDNLAPGSYAVWSRSRWAVGIDDSGVMEYFVRFAHGRRAAIGFHTIPTKLGRALQRVDELGTPQSHGCIRQATDDAIAMWRFAQEGTPVVVV